MILFKKLESWYISYPDNPDVADRLGDACYNIMIDIKDSDKEKMFELTLLLKKLQRDFLTLCKTSLFTPNHAIL